MKKSLIWLITFGWALLIWHLTTTPDFSVTEDSFLSFLISNGGHFIFFGIQAVLIFFSIYTLYSIRYTLYLPTVSAILTSLYGLLIELVQRGIPGRSADLMDLVLDTLGAVTFLAIINQYITQKSLIVNHKS